MLDRAHVERLNRGRDERLGRAAEPQRFVRNRPDAQFGLEIPPELAAVMKAEGIAPRISRDEALQVPAVLRARNLIAGTLATLPLKHIAPGQREQDWPLFDQPNPNMATSVMFALTFEDLFFEGIAWWRITRRRFDDFPAAAEWIDHRRIHVPPAPGTVGTGLGIQQVTPDFPIPPNAGTIFIDGLPVDDSELIQFLSPNPPFLVHGARAIRTALRLDRTAAMYADEPMPLTYFDRPEGSDPLQDEEIQAVLDDWAVKRRERSTGYVGGLRLNELGWDAEKIQLADQRNHAVLEIARAAGLDPEELGVSTTSRTYQNSEHRRQDQLDFTLGHYVSAFQDRLSMRDVLPRGHVARVKFDGFLRTTTPQRMQSYKVGLEVGAYTEDEIRDLEDRPPLTPAQKARKDALNGVSPTQVPEPSNSGQPAMSTTTIQFPYDVRRDERCPSSRPWAVVKSQTGELIGCHETREGAVDQRQAISIRERENNSNGNGHQLATTLRFEADEPVRVSFDADEAAETFQVDAERRTITGLAVPWGKVARSGFSKWRFAQDSLRWSDASRVKLNLNHDFTQLIGRATRLQSGSKGLTATFKVARGTDGDRALALAEDKVLDGFSIEVDFNDEKGDGWQPDPSDESVRLVSQASLRGTALTGMPAFDDARVTRVAATRDGGKGTMPEETKPNGDGGGQGTVALEAGEFTQFMEGLAGKIGESHQNLTKELTASIGESISAGMKAALENIHDPQRDGPEPVRAARFTVQREAPVYTFDGRGASLVRDAWYAQREHDSEAQERIRKFHLQSAEVQKLAQSYVSQQAAQRAAQAQFGTQFATVTTGTASEVIPPGYRPDLFVPQLAQGRPLYNMLSRGTIANATPFVVPTFGSITGGTGDHTEGSPPTEGTLALGSETVTPGAVSGKLPLTREIVDSSNPAIDQIALSAMRESYAQQTEQKVYGALNGTANITAEYDGAPASAEDHVIVDIRDLLARYPFTRFAAPNGAAINQKVTRDLATSLDSDGRPLLPSVGAQNASGIGNAVTMGWFVDGLAFVPAWAMTDGLSDDVVLILNSMDAWAWESPVLAFRFEEKQGPEIIELALFGYFATHVLRPAGVFAVRNPAT